MVGSFLQSIEQYPKDDKQILDLENFKVQYFYELLFYKRFKNARSISSILHNSVFFIIVH